MPKQIPDSEIEAIMQAVGNFPAGALIEDINNVLIRAFSRRTLQRRLAKLVEQNKLIVEGGGRQTRYKLAPQNVIKVGMISETETILPIIGLSPITVSAKGTHINKIVRLPIQDRKPVGYRREFLDAYQPNQSFYLSEQTRQHLREKGGVPTTVSPAGTYAVQIYNRLLIDLTWNSSRLEGNTYSLLETERLLALGEAAEGKDAFETQMILNHKAAIELLVNSTSEIGFNSYTLCNLHALLSDNLLPDPAACGRLREQPVGIGGSVFHPLESAPLIKEGFDEVLRKASAIQDPFEQAFFTMVQLPYLQPFDDVNKRTSRLAVNIPLIRENLSPLSFVDVPEQACIDGLLGVYELNRTELLRDVFVWAYERSCARYSAVRQSMGEPDKFRLQYRDNIAGLITNIVSASMVKKIAVQVIKDYAANEIDPIDQARFIEVTETELMNLHEGNMARYRIRPSQFSEWNKNWH